MQHSHDGPVCWAARNIVPADVMNTQRAREYCEHWQNSDINLYNSLVLFEYVTFQNIVQFLF